MDAEAQDNDGSTARDPAARRRHPLLFRVAQAKLRPRWRLSEITVTEEPEIRRAVRAAALGNAMEWFDYGIYAYLAVTLGDVFYSGASEGTRTILSLATFAVSFAVRPLGGAFFGPLGDRVGRKQVLALTMILMASATFSIGLIPSYDTIGLWAPLLLIIARLTQGFSTGGEYGGAATFIAEYAPDKRRGYYGSFLEMGTLAGYIGASGLVLVLTAGIGEDGMASWGWRIPFLIGGPLGAIGLYLRLRLEETPAFVKSEAGRATVAEVTGEAEPALGRKTEGGKAGGKQTPGELRRIMAGQRQTMLLCIALVAAYNVANYMLLTYMPTYLTEVLDWPRAEQLAVVIATMVAMISVVTLVGRANDRIGRKPLLMIGMVGFLVVSAPAYILVRQGAVLAVFGGMLLLGACLICLQGTMSATLPALFPTEVRYGSLAIGYNLSVAVFGGTTPAVIEGLVHVLDTPMAAAYYTMAFAVVGIVSVSLLTETAGLPLEGSPPAVATAAEAEEVVRTQRRNLL
ncbi:MFS transporter [Streptomyces sp. WAC 06738]|uniref:MFS transporter n=1 Tax=Streptomyces sp. WAC 06738 TaxID=2203210 RepID=UPI000F71D678|nr:MFS transporter [Streptomyces sp. WAC 06738]AZM49879.1 MFS transporter [Streptomyces sp. WAC 06738]